MREGEKLKAPRYASAAVTRNSNLPSRDGSLPYVTATYLIPDNIKEAIVYTNKYLSLY